MLGQAGKKMYNFVREDLRIPFVGPETLTTPTSGKEKGPGITMGDLNGRVREAMADGALYKVVVDCLREAEV